MLQCPAVTPEQFQAYVQDRHQAQVQYFSRRSAKSKRWYVFFQTGAIIFAVAAPLLVVSLPPSLKVITATVSALAAFFTTALKSFRFHETWTSARSMVDLLKRERYLYMAELDAYRDPSDRERLFVERVESLLAKESAVWLASEKASPDVAMNSGSGQKSSGNSPSGGSSSGQRPNQPASQRSDQRDQQKSTGLEQARDGLPNSGNK